MPRGDKSSYTGKQKRKAQHIEEGYEARGCSTDEAERRAWATVNKQDGGGRAKRKTSKTKSRSASRKKVSQGKTTSRRAKSGAKASPKRKKSSRAR